MREKCTKAYCILYSGNEKNTKEIKKTVLFTIASTKINTQKYI